MKLLHVLIGFLALTSVAFAATQQPTLSGKPLSELQDLATAGPRILKKRKFSKVVKKVAKTAIKAYVTYSTPGGAYYARIQKAQQMIKKARAAKAQIDRIRELNRIRKTQGWKGVIKTSAKSHLKAYAMSRFQNSGLKQKIQTRVEKYNARVDGFRNKQQAKFNAHATRWNVRAARFQAPNQVHRFARFGGQRTAPQSPEQPESPAEQEQQSSDQAPEQDSDDSDSPQDAPSAEPSEQQSPEAEQH